MNGDDETAGSKPSRLSRIGRQAPDDRPDRDDAEEGEADREGYVRAVAADEDPRDAHLASTPSARPVLWTGWLGYLAGALLAIGIDALLAPTDRRLDVRTAAPRELYAGEEGRLEVALGTPVLGVGADADSSAGAGAGGRRRLRVEVLVDVDPARLEPQPPAFVDVPAGGRAELAIPLVPKRRGRARLLAVWLRVPGPLGLVSRVVRRELDHEVAVVPNVGAVQRTALKLFGAREQATGVKIEQYIGDGSEFESLREYVPGYDAGSIDWRASARNVKLMVREFRAERNHQVILAFDTGHLMGEPLDGLPKVDHAINAGLILAYVALKTGDRVGLYSFDERPRAFLEPAGGVRAFERLRRATGDVEYTTAETNFTLGVADLATRVSRRSLVVVFTDFVDTVTAELMIENMDRLARRHLVVFVALEDPSLGAIAHGEPSSLARLHRAVEAADLERERKLVLERLASRGVHCVDAAPRAVSTPLLNSYLEIRRRELV